MKPNNRKISILLQLLILISVSSLFAQTPPAPPSPWEADILAFEKADSIAAPQTGAALFIGSSSIRLWPDLAADFPGVAVIQRGYGGSQIEDAVRFAPRIVWPYRPRRIVLYAGDNDLASGKTPPRVAGDFKAFADTVLGRLPDAHIAFIAVKPSIARWHLVDSIRTANAAVAALCGRDDRLEYLDVFTPMLGPDGTPRKELLAEDGLHLSRAGYDLWKGIVAPFLE